MNTLFQSYFPVDILELIIKGMIIGMAASAPMGPVGILCVQRTQKKGRWYGFVTGVGAAVSDFIYALITGIGLSFVLDFINNPVYKFYFQLAGGVMLLVFGLYSFLNNPLRNAHKGGQKSTGSLWYNCWTGFLITLQQSAHRAPLHGPVQHVQLCGAQSSVGHVRGLCEHHWRCCALVVRADLARR